MTDLSDSAPVRNGEILADKYRVDRVLGVGGMGVVVAATHITIGKHVAIKFMLPDALTMPVTVERFTREARAAVRLRSEHIAQVLDVGTLANGSPFMVMEYLDGSDLGEVVQRRGRLPEHEAIDLVIQACEAVAEAHKLGIVHRDLKLRNLFLTRRVDGSPLVKVLDFGISKTLPEKDKPDDQSLTRTTEIMGSPNYMSPEQIRSAKNVDQRTDIWGLGCILYELLAARVPFLAESLPQLCGLVLTEPPTPLPMLRPDVTPGVWRAIQQCLEKDPRMRFQSVGDLVVALAPFAPPHSQLSVSRIRVLTNTLPTSPAAVSSSAPQMHAPGVTSISWAETKRGAQRKRLVPVLAACVGGLAIVGVFIAVLRTRGPVHLPPPPPPSAPATSPGPALPPPVDPSAAPPAASLSTPPPPSSPPASSQVSPPPRSSVTPPVRPKSSSVPIPSVPAKGTGDPLMPGDRK